MFFAEIQYSNDVVLCFQNDFLGLTNSTPEIDKGQGSFEKIQPTYSDIFVFIKTNRSLVKINGRIRRMNAQITVTSLAQVQSH